MDELGSILTIDDDPQTLRLVSHYSRQEVPLGQNGHLACKVREPLSHTAPSLMIPVISLFWCERLYLWRGWNPQGHGIDLTHRPASGAKKLSPRDPRGRDDKPTIHRRMIGELRARCVRIADPVAFRQHSPVEVDTAF